MWDGQRIVSGEWVKESVTPYFQTDEPQLKYGFKWWMAKQPDSTEYVWMCRGFGGQNLLGDPRRFVDGKALASYAGSCGKYKSR